jgi:leucyl aminopeptidase (aminopeptidase T)
MKNLIAGARRIAEACMHIRQGEEALIIAEEYARPTRFGQAFCDAMRDLGAQVTTVTMPRRWSDAQEPPKPVAMVMKSVDVMLIITEYFAPFHTTATKEAIQSGVRYYGLVGVTEEEIEGGVSSEDLRLIESRTGRIVEILSEANHCKVRSPKGTALEFQLSGRKGVAIHPLVGFLLPYYAEAAISPVEETGNGRLVIDGEIIGWGSILEEPIDLFIEKGRIVKVDGNNGEADRMRNILASHQNADNCPAELGIGTSHLVAPWLKGTRMDAAKCGRLHIAFGRNDTIGGTVTSDIHSDILILLPSVEVDGRLILKNGVFVPSL